VKLCRLSSNVGLCTNHRRTCVQVQAANTAASGLDVLVETDSVALTDDMEPLSGAPPSGGGVAVRSDLLQLALADATSHRSA
jgi:hypothetical protein